MMKKGAMHLDWMVSMGIFLLFLLSIFIFFKPGAEPAYQGNYLLSILENELEKNIFYSIERIPISRDDIDLDIVEDLSYLRFSFEGDFPLCDGASHFKIIDSNLKEVGHQVSPCSSSGDRTGTIEVSKSVLVGNTAKFYLLYSEKFDNPDSVNCKTSEDVEGGEEPNCHKYTSNIKVGVSEIVSGLNDEQLDIVLLYLDAYYDSEEVNIKEDMGYPISKDFKICINDLEDINCHPHNNVIRIPDDVNVFAKKISLNKLKENTKLGNIVDIYVRAW